MAVGFAKSDFEELESSAIPTATGFELLASAPRQHSQNNLARDLEASCLYDAPCISSGLNFDARNENCRMPASRATESPNPNHRQTLSHINSKFASHPWTDSTEFIELRSDIPGESVNHDWSDQELKSSGYESGLASRFAADSKHDCSRFSSKHPSNASGEFVELWSDIPNQFHSSPNLSGGGGRLKDQNCGTSASNVVLDLKYDSSLMSWDISKRTWTAPGDYVVLWSDIPREFDVNQNRSSDRNELMDENGAAPSSLSNGMIHSQQHLSAPSKSQENSSIESEDLSKVTIIALEDTTSNKNYSNGPEKKVTCCRLFSECFRRFQNFAMSFRKHMVFLVMVTLISLVPTSATYMGMAHTSACPANDVVAHLMYMAGLAGVFLIGVLIGNHFAKETRQDLKDCVKVLFAITSILLLVEMMFFYAISPSFERKSTKYCDETFYNYAFYTNIAAAGIVFLSVLLQHPYLKHLVNNLAF